MQKIKELYWLRFNARERKVKNELWKVLCRDFLQRYIEQDAAVMDLGAGACEFINNIRCDKKYALDINEDIKNCAAKDVAVFTASGVNMSEIPDDSLDIVFSSEFFEHLKSVDELLGTLIEIRRVLKKSGRLIVICPNIRYLANRYWDFIDHQLPISHISMREGLILHNFKIMQLIPRFLPFTTKSMLPKSIILLRAYLKLPFLWNIFGKQMFIVAQKD